MYALVDGNNFYVSCERVFRPSLNGRPVVVLSNTHHCASHHGQRGWKPWESRWGRRGSRYDRRDPRPGGLECQLHAVRRHEQSDDEKASRRVWAWS